ncbi:sulfate anion transporter [Fomitiporia mediterranea MF3/22]|uniref:sulfate anion transporter n=1 Tax=Fomitiporia mediterranea (strain MF3/22) TaxID=694068 RepID=UPI0004408304|nr:sulfate anion transporter [Fomitiporia mediterranea MF3/22]EJD08166.1 sulfate anion transporter [Fomitiporia mediterranea MF3/22]
MQSGTTSPARSFSERSALLPSTQDAVERGEPSYKQNPRSSAWPRVNYYIPFTAWLPNYSISLLGGDFLAGLSVACILIPQSISYATSLARLSPLAGLFSAAIPGIVYALLGTSRQLNVAPEAALSLLIGQTVQGALHSDPHDHPHNPDAIGIAISTITTLQVGVFAFLLGFFRLGFIDVLLSRALLRGFITAIAVIISIEQFIPMFGLSELEHALNPETTLDKLIFLIRNVTSHEHRPTTIISFGALAILVFFRYFKAFFKNHWFIYRLPEVLIVVIASTILSNVFDWDDLGVSVLGSVPITSSERSFVRFPLHQATLRYAKSTTSTAVLIAVIGYLDSIVAAKQNASRFGYSISPNRELVALGAANIVGSFVPGLLPAFGSITRSRINGDVGGRSQMASLICSAFVLLATFFLLPALYYLPRCVLASIVFLVVFSILAEAPHDISYFWRMRSWTDFGLMSITFFTTLFWNVEVGIVCSIICSLLLVVHKSSKPRLTILGRIPGTTRWKPVNEYPEAEEDVPGALIIRLRDNLDFANTAQLKERLRRLELYGHDPSHPSDTPRREQASVIVFHLADLETCDASAAQIFYELLENYKSRSVEIFIAHLRPSLLLTFERAGIVALLGEEAFFQDVAAAMVRVEMAEVANLNL